MIVLTERIHDGFGVYEQVWECPPPPKGLRFRVLRQEWAEDYSVRTIYEWAPA